MNAVPAPRFDHRESGTPASAWTALGALERLAPLPLDAVLAAGHLVVVAAHPDDETLGAGGLMATAAARGARVDVVVATLGERSHPHSPTHTPAALAAVRRTEVREAVRHLAPQARVHQLDLPDGALGEAAGRLTAHLSTVMTPSCAVVAPWRDDGHPDHAAAARAAALAVASAVTAADVQQPAPVLLEYPIWAWHWAVPDPASFAGLAWSRLRRLPLDAAARTAKQAAMAAHASQVEPLSSAPGDEAIVAPGFAAHFERAVEVFVVAPATSLPRQEASPS